MNTNNFHEGIDIISIFNKLLQKKLFIMISTVIIAIGSVLYALSLPNIYQSKVLLAPNNHDNFQKSNQQPLSGLASLAGISISNNANKTLEGIEIVKSFSFFKMLASNDKNLLPNLVGATSWDKNTNSIIYDQELYDNNKSTWISSEFSDVDLLLQKAFLRYKKSISISQDIKSGLVILSVEHYSPYFAKQLADNIIYLVNKSMKEYDVLVAENSILYLNKQIGLTNFIEIKQALSSLVQSQIQTIMIAESSPEYIFRTIDPAEVSKLKSKPARSRICIIITIIGFIVSCIASYFFDLKTLRLRS